jgi:hypothetical protein
MTKLCAVTLAACPPWRSQRRVIKCKDRTPTRLTEAAVEVKRSVRIVRLTCASFVLQFSIEGGDHLRVNVFPGG